MGMKTLYPLFVVLNFVITISNAEQVPLSQVVTNTQLGQIETVTDGNIIEAVVRANPQLPSELKDSTAESLYVSTKYDDNKHALIGVRPGTNYEGYVEVFFNGGQPPLVSSRQQDDSGKLNLSRRTDLVRNLKLKRGAKATSKAIIDAFMNANPQLPTGLRTALKATQITTNSATLYVPQPNFEYEGSVRVLF